MRIGNFEILISSLPHKERPVAEIYFNNLYWSDDKVHTFP